MVRGGRKEEGSGWGTRVYLWWIHVDIWQNQYNIVKLKKKKEIYKKDLHNPDNHDGVITHLEPDILECEVKPERKTSIQYTNAYIWNLERW